MRVITHIIGASDAPHLVEPLHRLAHAHAIDRVIVPRADLARRRFKARSEAGREIAIALPREQQLFDGAVLSLEPSAALIVQVETEHWLRLRPRDAAAALKLGYLVGNLHWRVRFEDDLLLVAVETEEKRYRDRLEAILEAGEVELLNERVTT